MGYEPQKEFYPFLGETINFIYNWDANLESPRKISGKLSGVYFTEGKLHIAVRYYSKNGNPTGAYGHFLIKKITKIHCNAELEAVFSKFQSIT